MHRSYSDCTHPIVLKDLWTALVSGPVLVWSHENVSWIQLSRIGIVQNIYQDGSLGWSLL